MHIRGINLNIAVLHIHTINTFTTEKIFTYTYIKHIFKTEYIGIQRSLDIEPLIYHGVFGRGHERTWFSSIIYNAPPETQTHNILEGERLI